MKKFLRLGALSLALIMGFSSCSKNKENTPNNDADNLSTYVGVDIAFPTADGLRANLPDDYNKIGEWKGRDDIQKVTIYLVNKTKNKIDYASFNKDSFDKINNDGFLKPRLAVKATAGEGIVAYAVINDLNNLTDELTKIKTAVEFESKFKELIVKVQKSNEVAKFNGTSDVVLMTNDKIATDVKVKDGVSKEEAISGKNRVEIEVSRIVSRAIVTMAKENMTIKVKDLNGDEVISNIIVKDVKYAVGQSNKNVYYMKKDDFKTPDPVYSYVPQKDWSNKNIIFDYSDLKSPKKPEIVANENEVEQVKTALKNEKFSKFVLPVTHQDGNYKKGNITYFEITCKFEVDKVYNTPAGEKNETFKSNVSEEDVYLGMSDGKFYNSRENAIANGQQATKYKGGVMKYVIWLNPNVGYNSKERITESPTVRNQVYHAHISGFKEIGVPYNPLNPDDENPDPENPDNPIDPNDDPETEKTYLSVSVTVLPWTIHSYTVNLGNRY